ncbi:MAG TPA: hypothetical protein VFG04_02720, partial [Planctomycetaceae bacterium]|nr:hypothetical protein [Planctomycetaceae bacterium]
DVSTRVEKQSRSQFQIQDNERWAYPIFALGIRTDLEQRAAIRPSVQFLSTGSGFAQKIGFVQKSADLFRKAGSGSV